MLFQALVLAALVILILLFTIQIGHTMALSTRAQAIVDRLNRLNTIVQTQIAAEEAAHDATNDAANAADDDGIEGALATIEAGLGVQPADGSTAPANNPSGDPLPAAE